VKNKTESLQLTLSRKQFETLVGMLYLGDWVLHAHEVPGSRGDTPEQELMRSVLTLAKDMGFVELVFEGNGEFGPSRLLEDRMQPCIDAYDAQTMWDELVLALGQRDAERSVGLEALEKLPPNQRAETLIKHEEFWAEEFEQHGLERLAVADPDGKST
jgi:hypothetical protein